MNSRLQHKRGSSRLEKEVFVMLKKSLAAEGLVLKDRYRVVHILENQLGLCLKVIDPSTGATLELTVSAFHRPGVLEDSGWEVGLSARLSTWPKNQPALLTYWLSRLLKISDTTEELEPTLRAQFLGKYARVPDHFDIENFETFTSTFAEALSASIAA